GINAELSQNERLCVRQGLQTGKIALERFGLMQIDIEAEEVVIFRLQKFRRRKRSKRTKAFGINSFGFIDEFVNEISDLGNPAPADDIGWDFVYNTVSEHRRMAFALAHGIPNRFARILLRLPGFQEAKMFRPWNIDE